MCPVALTQIQRELLTSSLCLMLIKSSWLNSGLELATLTLLLEHDHTNHSLSHKLALSNLIPIQKAKLKGPTTDINQQLTQVHPAFVTISERILELGHRLVDNFSSHFSFYFPDKSDTENKKCYLTKLKCAFSSS